MLISGNKSTASTQSLSMPQEALDHLVDDIIDPANKFLAINKLLEEIKQQSIPDGALLAYLRNKRKVATEAVSAELMRCCEPAVQTAQLFAARA